MKTKIRTIAALSILGLVGLINGNAYANSTSHNFNEGLRNSATENKTEKLTSNLMATGTEAATSYDLEKEAQLYTKWVVDQEEAKLVNKLNAKSEELIEAEAFTSLVVDQEEAKLLEKVMKSIETAEVE